MKTIKCTKPNCDCAEKEMINQGTEYIKSYPCLNADTSANEPKSEFKKLSNRIEPGGTVAITIDEAATKYGAEYYKKDKPANTYTFHEGFKVGANWMADQQKQQIIQIIEDRIAELEIEAKDLVLPLRMHKHTAIYTAIIELKNTLKLIK